MNASHYDHEKLRRLREEKYTQKELAERLDVAEMTVSRAEKGVTVSYDLLLRMCGLLHADIRQILKVDTVTF